ncbi:MAG: hypothetical protein Q4B70_15460 [Lachnospiraceae bacterium]|nr:hypothetical protein [Lachnospiraceae bacterium]
MSINTRLVLKNSLLAFVIKGMSFIVSILTVPVFISYFSNQAVLGVWYTVLSIITWLIYFDLGIGNGLRNCLVKSFADNDNERTRQLILSSYLMIGCLVVVAIIILYPILSIINWNSFLNISNDLVSSDILLQVTRYIFTGVLLQFFSKLITSILYALQKSAVNDFLGLLCSLFQLAFILIAPSKSPQENLLLLAKAYIVISILPYTVMTILMFFTKLKEVKIKRAYFSINACKQLAGIGGLFFVCQILYMLIINTNEYLITLFTGPENVVDYSIYNKAFLLAGTLALLALTPVWSIVTKAIAKNEFAWLSKLYRISLLITPVICIIEICIALLFKNIVLLWLGNASISIKPWYIAIFVVWGTVFTYQSVLSTFACGTGKIKLQAISYSIGVIFKGVFLTIFFKYTNSWIAVVISNIIILVPYCILQQISLNKYFSQLSKESNNR